MKWTIDIAWGISFDGKNGFCFTISIVWKFFGYNLFIRLKWKSVVVVFFFFLFSYVDLTMYDIRHMAPHSSYNAAVLSKSNSIANEIGMRLEITLLGCWTSMIMGFILWTTANDKHSFAAMVPLWSVFSRKDHEPNTEDYDSTWWLFCSHFSNSHASRKRIFYHHCCSSGMMGRWNGLLNFFVLNVSIFSSRDFNLNIICWSRNRFEY